MFNQLLVLGKGSSSVLDLILPQTAHWPILSFLLILIKHGTDS